MSRNNVNTLYTCLLSILVTTVIKGNAVFYKGAHLTGSYFKQVIRGNLVTKV